MKNTVRLNTLKYKNAEDSGYLKELHVSPEYVKKQNAEISEELCRLHDSPEYWKKEYEKQIKKQRKDEGHFDEDEDKKS